MIKLYLSDINFIIQGNHNPLKKDISIICYMCTPYGCLNVLSMYGEFRTIGSELINNIGIDFVPLF